jgi:hypothetical protein
MALEGGVRLEDRQHDVEGAVRELADALQTLVLSVEAHYRPPVGYHVRAEALQPVARRVLKAAQAITTVLESAYNGSRRHRR